MTINEIESMDLTLEKSAMPTLPSKLWLEPWWAGVVLMYNGVPIIAGPIVNRPIETRASLRVTVQGPRALLARRGAIVDMNNWSGLHTADGMNAWTSYGRDPNTDMYNVYKDWTYPTLIRLAIEQSMKKHGGQLPIRFTIPKIAHVDSRAPDPITGLAPTEADLPHNLYIRGDDMNEATVESIIQKLINLDNGPDVLFKPTLTSRNSIQWGLITGRTDADNEIPNGSDTIWDTTSPSGYISNLDVNYIGSEMTNRAFVRGSGGSNGGQTTRMSENSSLRDAGYPLLESYEMISEDSAAKVQAHARETLREHDNANHQINAEVRADGLNKLGTFWPGEYARLITEGWYGLNNGSTRAKILSISGDLTNNVSISFKETEVL